jgi:hypothetical protein
VWVSVILILFYLQTKKKLNVLKRFSLIFISYIVTFCGASRLSHPATRTCKSTKQKRKCPVLFFISSINFVIFQTQRYNYHYLYYIDRHSDYSFLTWLIRKVYIPKYLQYFLFLGLGHLIFQNNYIRGYFNFTYSSSPYKNLIISWL